MCEINKEQAVNGREKKVRQINNSFNLDNFNLHLLLEFTGKGARRLHFVNHLVFSKSDESKFQTHYHNDDVTS